MSQNRSRYEMVIDFPINEPADDTYADPDADTHSIAHADPDTKYNYHH